MTLTAKKYGEMYSKDSSASNGLAQEEITDLESSFNNHEHITDKGMFSVLKPVLYQIKLLQEELDYLRTEISANKAKDPIPKPGNTTVTFSDMTVNKGVYSIRLTASRNFGGKTGVVTKSIDLRLL